MRLWLVRRPIPTVLAALLAALVPLAAPGLAQEPSELARSRDRLDTAERRLSDIEAQLRRTARAVEDAEHRRAAAADRLAEVRTRLRGAEQRMRAALAADRRIAGRLADATRRLDRHLAEREAARETLDARAVELYKRDGAAVSGALWLQGVAGADSLHDIAVATRTVRSLLRRDTALIDGMGARTDAVLGARDEVFELRRASRDRAEEALRRRREVAALVDRRASLLDDIRREEQRRGAALAALEEDRTATAVLVRRLEAEVAALGFDAARALLAANATAPLDGPVPGWAAALPPGGRAWAPAIAGAASRAGVDARLLAALVWTESGFSPTAVSRAGALGLAQLMPGTAAGLDVDAYVPAANLAGGARYLRTQLQRFGRLDLALAAYNAGPERVAAAGPGVPDIVETQLYVLRVLERYARVRAG